MEELPLRPVEDHPSIDKIPPMPAPPWVALLCAWVGLITLICALALPFLPGSRRPREELEHRAPFALTDRWLPFPIYLSVVTLFLGVVVLRQMRKEPRPLTEGLAAQRMQTWVGIWLAIVAIVFIYAWVYYSVAWRATAGAL